VEELEERLSQFRETSIFYKINSDEKLKHPEAQKKKENTTIEWK
jgi:hypothetical protein